MTVIKGMAELEMLCVNSRENFEDNKRFLKMRLEEEENPAIRKLLQQDTSHLIAFRCSWPRPVSFASLFG